MSGNVYKTGHCNQAEHQSRRQHLQSEESPTTSRRSSESSPQLSPQRSPDMSKSPRRKTIPANSPLCPSPTFSRHNVPTTSRYSKSPSTTRRRGSCDSLSPMCRSPRLPGKSPTRSNGLSTSPNKLSPFTSPSLKRKGAAGLQPGQTWTNMSPSLRKKILGDIPNDMDGETSLVDWYKKQGIGPEMLVDMPLVRKIYMTNIEREINKEKHPKEVKEPMPEVEEVGLPERYTGRRFSSLLSKEAQLASVGMYEDEVFHDKPEDKNHPTDIYPDNINSEELTQRLQKAMHALDVSKETQEDH